MYFNRHGVTLGLVCGAYSSIFLDTDSVEGKGKKDIQILCYRKRIFKQIAWNGMFSYQTNSNHKNYHLANIRPPSLYKFSLLIQDLGCGLLIRDHYHRLTSIKLGVKIKKKDYQQCICLWAVSHFLIAITGSKSTIFRSSRPIHKIQNALGRKLWSVNRNGQKDI